MSLRRIGDQQRVDRMREALAAHHLEPAVLTVEVTENAAFTDLAAASDFLNRIRALGGQAWRVDDFGSGVPLFSRCRNCLWTA